MEIPRAVWSALAAGAALLSVVAALGFVVVGGVAEPAAVGVLLLCTAFFTASAFPTVRTHSAYSLVNAGSLTAMATGWFIVASALPGVDGVAVGLIGAVATLGAGGLLVELYSYRRGTSRRRPD